MGWVTSMRRGGAMLRWFVSCPGFHRDLIARILVLDEGTPWHGHVRAWRCWSASG